MWFVSREADPRGTVLARQPIHQPPISGPKRYHAEEWSKTRGGGTEDMIKEEGRIIRLIQIACAGAAACLQVRYSSPAPETACLSSASHLLSQASKKKLPSLGQFLRIHQTNPAFVMRPLPRIGEPVLGEQEAPPQPFGEVRPLLRLKLP